MTSSTASTQSRIRAVRITWLGSQTSRGLSKTGLHSSSTGVTRLNAFCVHGLPLDFLRGGKGSRRVLRRV
ncbi:hypothetical protein VTK26DRAFT_9388 [Humicola hyalothermophila]